mgnify:CR=1 FL=1
MKRFESKVLWVCVLTLLLGTADYANAGIDFWIDFDDSNDRPSNDNCHNARLIGDVKDLYFDTTLATFDGPGYCIVNKPVIINIQS